MASPQLVSGHAVGYAISWPIRALVGVDPMVIVIGANSVLANAFGWSTGITICAGACKSHELGEIAAALWVGFQTWWMPVLVLAMAAITDTHSFWVCGSSRHPS